VTPRERLIVALDVPNVEQARELTRVLSGVVGMFKVGSQLFTSAGPDFVRELVEGGEQVFLDLKFHDIPNTVAAAVAEAARLRVSLATVHALGGRAMMRAAAQAARGIRLVAVTILTSHDDLSLAEVGVRGPAVDSVRRLALLAKDAALSGVVASPKEAALIREGCGEDFLIITPGIRPSGAASEDQVRLATPGAAFRAGASHLVVGRPITQAKDPRAAAESIVEEMTLASP
jgi:orotidine-5'-phosphate decarboxylase